MRIKRTIYLIILFIFLSGKKVCASGLPSNINPTQLSTVESFSSQVPTYYFEANGIDLMGSSFEDASNNFDNTIFDTSFTWETKSFQNDILWRPSQNLYDSQGNIVPADQAALAMGTSDFCNTYFLYDTVSGDILNIGDDFSTSVSSVNASSTSTFQNRASEILSMFGPSSPKAPLAIFNQSQMAQSEIEKISTLSNSAYIYDPTHDIGFFAPNVNLPGLLNTTEYWMGYNIFYFNDNAPYTFWNNWESGGGWQNMKPQSGSFGLNGYTYGNMFPPSGMTFGSGIQVKINNSNNTNKIDNATFYLPSEPYDTDETVNLTKFLDQKITKHYSVNPNYDDSKPYTVDNSMFDIDTSSPTYSPTYNYYYYIQYEFNSPQQGGSIGSVSDNDLTNNVPVLNNLEKRFPFSIPWDIYTLLKGLDVQRETPYIDTTVTIPGINYEWHIEYDLSDFDNIASLFRTLELILFIIGLCWISYDHFFGK